jgi:hypothetical protein
VLEQSGHKPDSRWFDSITGLHLWVGVLRECILYAVNSCATRHGVVALIGDGPTNSLLP